MRRKNLTRNDVGSLSAYLLVWLLIKKSILEYKKMTGFLSPEYLSVMLLDEVSAAWTLPKSLHGWIHGVFSKKHDRQIRILHINHD